MMILMCNYWDYLIQHVCRELVEKPKRENKEPVVDDEVHTDLFQQVFVWV